MPDSGGCKLFLANRQSMRMLWLCLLFIWLPGCSRTEAESKPAPTASATAPSFSWKAEPDAVERLEAHVVMLAKTIGQRNIENPQGYKAAENYLATQLEQLGYKVERQTYPVGAHKSVNLWAEKKGSRDEVIVLGAHYDSADSGTPGADDNASGCAAVLELARNFREYKGGPTLRFVFFANEEPPYFHDETMGSLVYAKKCQIDGDKIVAMLSLECIGFYSDQPGSQKLPAVIANSYPTTGNFIAFVSDLGSKALMEKCLAKFQAAKTLPAEGIAAPTVIDGINWSDHWAFWKCGYPALMVTDTAIYRNPNYHMSSDTAASLDYEKMAAVVEGVRQIVVGFDAE